MQCQRLRTTGAATERGGAQSDKEIPGPFQDCCDRKVRVGRRVEVKGEGGCGSPLSEKALTQGSRRNSWESLRHIWLGWIGGG